MPQVRTLRLVALITSTFTWKEQLAGRSGVLRPPYPGLIGPAALVLTCAVIMFVGGRHFGNGWPGTGGHRPGLVPGGIAAFSWASTLSVSSYWAHPGALAGFPAAELAWMAASPLYSLRTQRARER